MNIWSFTDADWLSITTKDGKAFIGELIAIDDTEDTGDIEDSITIRTKDGVYRGFYPSEIKSIIEIESQ